jgi:hypothetical protein
MPPVPFPEKWNNHAHSSRTPSQSDTVLCGDAKEASAARVPLRYAPLYLIGACSHVPFRLQPTTLRDIALDLPSEPVALIGHLS